MWAFFAPAAHPMDLIYNHGVRHLFGAVALPPNPLQRRLACLAAGVMNAAAAFLFMGGMPTAALIVGGALLVLQVIVITTHFCTLSYMYEWIMRAIGKWHQPIGEEEGRRLIEAGATLVDVRGPDEFSRDAIEGAINAPVDTIQERAAELKNLGDLLLYCRSGMRSQIAAEKLKAAGIDSAFDGGALARVQRMRAA
jgi:rhodanese-related sulfurtransferase